MTQWIGKGILLVIAVCVLVLTYRAEWILKTVLRIESPAPEQILRVKMAALGIGVLLLVAALLLF